VEEEGRGGWRLLIIAMNNHTPYGLD